MEGVTEGVDGGADGIIERRHPSGLEVSLRDGADRLDRLSLDEAVMGIVKEVERQESVADGGLLLAEHRIKSRDGGFFKAGHGARAV